MIDGLRRLDPFDELPALLLFYARDGFARLRLAADIAAWWDRYRSSEAIAALKDHIERHPRLARPWCTALAVAVGIAGLPDATLTPRMRKHGRRAMLAARLANWDLRGDPDQIIANVTLVDGLPAPPGGVPAFARRRLTAHQAPAQNVVKTIMRYALALPQLRRGRSWSPLPAVARAGSHDSSLIMPTRPVLTLRDITKCWPGADSPVLERIDLRVEPGAVLRIAGANGAGKTTLARIAAGLIRPESGRVLLGELDAEVDRMAFQRGIGFLSAASAGLYARLTVRDHLRLWSRLALVSGRDAAEASERAVGALGLHPFGGRRVDRHRCASASACASPAHSSTIPRSFCSTSHSTRSTTRAPGC
jgi:ABC-type multidrug transport system fused ATPase/permease subunit